MSFESTSGSQKEAFIQWFENSAILVKNFGQFFNCEAVTKLFGEMIDQDLAGEVLASSQVESRWKAFVTKLNQISDKLLGSCPYKIRPTELANSKSQKELFKVLSILLQLSVKSPNKDKFVGAIMQTKEEYQEILAEILQNGMHLEGGDQINDDSMISNESAGSDEGEESKFSPKLAELRAKLQKSDQEKKKLQMKIQELQEDTIDYKRKLEGYQKEMDKLRQNSRLDQEKKTDNVEEEQLKAQKDTDIYLNEIQTKLEQRQIQVKNLQDLLQKKEIEYQQQIQSLGAQIEVEKVQTKKLNEAQKQLAYYKNLSQNIERLKQAEVRLTQQNSRLKQQLNSFKVETSNSSDLKSSINYLNTQLTNENQKNQQLVSQINQKNSQISVLTAQKSKHEKEITYLKERESQLKENVNDLKEKLEDKNTNNQNSALFSGQIASIQIQEQLDLLKKQNAALKMKGEDSLNAQILRLQQALKKEQTERKRFQQSNDLAKAQLKESEGENDVLQNELNRLRGEQAKAGDLQSDFRSLRKERDAALDKLSKANQKLEEFDKIMEELDSLKKEKMVHVEDLKKAISDKGDLQDKIIQLKEEMVEKDGQFSKTSSELAVIKRSNIEMQTKMKQLEEESKLYIKQKLILEKGIKDQNKQTMSLLEKDRDLLKAKTQISDLKLKLREKDDEIAGKVKENERKNNQAKLQIDKQLREKETEFQAKQKDLLTKLQNKDLELQRSKQSFRDLRERTRREERLMSSAFHQLGLQFTRIQRNIAGGNNQETYLNEERKRTVDSYGRK